MHNFLGGEAARDKKFGNEIRDNNVCFQKLVIQLRLAGEWRTWISTPRRECSSTEVEKH